MAEFLPLLNAMLNGLSTILLCLGWRAIRRGERLRHGRYMAATLVCSALFLISYLIRFAMTGVHAYPGTGWDRTLYLTILGTHTPLAALVPVLALRAVYLTRKQRWESHRRLGRWTLPIWLYVSVTGVLIYIMLYGLH